MSIKRARQYGSAWGKESDITNGLKFNLDKTKGQERTWKQHMEGKSDDMFAPYSLKTLFTEGTYILHSKFGKGFVLKANSVHIEVLFSEGIKRLCHGKG